MYQLSHCTSFLIYDFIYPLACLHLGLPYFSKMAFGSGFTNKSWEKLYHDNKLFDAIKNKNVDILEFGLEHPIEKMVSYKEVITAKDEVTERQAHLEPSSSDDIEEPTIPEAAPNSQPIRKVHLSPCPMRVSYWFADP